MAHSIEVSDGTYEEFLRLKDMISTMTKEEVKNEEVISLMVQEFIVSVEMMQKEWVDENEDDDHECCGGHGGDDCCGEWHCHH